MPEEINGLKGFSRLGVAKTILYVEYDNASRLDKLQWPLDRVSGVQCNFYFISLPLDEMLLNLCPIAF